VTIHFEGLPITFPSEVAADTRLCGRPFAGCCTLCCCAAPVDTCRHLSTMILSPYLVSYSVPF